MSTAANAEQWPTAIAQGDPATDARAFRQCLGQYPTGVAVITIAHDGKAVGMAVNSFSAVSLDPPLVLWSLRRESSSAPAYLQTSHFAINVLAADQLGVSKLFGAPHPDRFSQVAWAPGESGAPLLAGALAHLECTRELIYEGGDHWIFLGRVVHFRRFSGDPLLFSQGQYAVGRPHPDLPMPPTLDSEKCAEHSECLFMTALSSANQHMSVLFQEHRRAEGVTVASARLVNQLSGGPQSLADLELKTYLERENIENGLIDLVARGFVRRNLNAQFELTELGTRKREALGRRASEFTAEKLEGLPDSDVAVAKRVLLELQRR